MTTVDHRAEKSLMFWGLFHSSYSSLVLIFSFQVVSSQDRPGYQSASHDNPGSEFRSFRTLIATFLSSERNRVCRDGADEA